VIGPELFD